jgi:phosphatidylglycerophosphate synthase
MSESLIQKPADVQGLSTAILLPSAGLFTGRGGDGDTDIGPLTNVGGISLFHRAVLTLQRAGIRQLIVLAGSEAETLKQTLIKGPRVTIPVRWMPIREFPLEDHRTWEALAAEVNGFCLIAGVEAVFSRDLIEELRQSVQDGRAIVIARQGARESKPVGRRNPTVQFDGDRLVAFHNQTGHETNQIAADLAVLPAGMMGATSQSGGGGDITGSMPIRKWLQQAAGEGRVRVISTTTDSSLWYCDVQDTGDVKLAELRLFQSLKGEFEGVVDRYFNRKVSRLFTRVFLLLGFSPNAITMVSTVIGLLAAVGFGFGTYAAGLTAALMFQLAAVIDCCDGEVARLTFTESPFGAWLDIVMDNIVHMAIFAGIAVGAYLRVAGSDDAWIPLVLGATAVVGNGLSFVLVSIAQKIKAASGWKTPVHAAWSDFMLKNVASRDFSVVVLLFALFKMLDWFLWIAALGSVVFSLVMVWLIRPSAISRA